VPSAAISANRWWTWIEKRAGVRGRGFSAKPETSSSIEHHCQDIEALISGLQLERVTVIGHSLGASIAAYFAATRPGRTAKAVLTDGGGQLSEEQMEKVVAGIRISLERLGKVFPDYESHIENLSKAPFFKQWNDYLDAYFRYEIEEVKGGVRSRVYPEGIQEELGNMKTMQMADYYKDISCPVSILRATEGMMGPDDLLLPEDAAEKMEKEIASARLLDIAGTNHYTLIFAENENRDRDLQALLSSV
jgi:pimeloyl-ACP methyl ester carboxylesterase